ncbi:DMT family transporter [Cupriavidus sp. 30B13]|uniref:DMT family transporter n=1 Tax=Cupriavidus sp. 30B13 TaxID=3384241 RepID=UPI003B8F7ABB
MTPLLMIAPLAGGAAAALETWVNGRLAAGLGNDRLMAALVSFVIGSLVLAGVAFARGGVSPTMGTLLAQPSWRLGGGLLGAVAICASLLASPRIGSVNTVSLFVFGQFLAAMLIDQHGLTTAVPRSMTVVRTAGVLVILCGVVLVLFGDKIAAAISRSS